MNRQKSKLNILKSDYNEALPYTKPSTAITGAAKGFSLSSSTPIGEEKSNILDNHGLHDKRVFHSQSNSDRVLARIDLARITGTPVISFTAFFIADVYPMQFITTIWAPHALRFSAAVTIRSKGP